MSESQLPFIDWLKAIGIGLIVWGHVAASTTVGWTPPVYPKQLGVAFFVFIMGYTLAREPRGRWRVVYNRYFEVALFGIVCAVANTVAGVLLWSDPLESNYLPFVFGANVLMNAFPANPTTWYIGTYLHLLLLWALVLRGRSVRPALILGCVALEIVVRATVIATAGEFVAYMLVSNWVSVLLVGLFAGSRRIEPHQKRVAGPRLAAFALVATWPLLMAAIPWKTAFPLMSLPRAGEYGPLITSAVVSFVYLAYTAAAYLVALRLPHVGLVHFLARNTVIVFVAHMPVYYMMEWVLLEPLPSYAWRVTLELVVCLFVLALLSEWLRRLIPTQRLRDRLLHVLILRAPALRSREA